MTVAAGRRTLASCPRAVLVVLLAFAIELLPPPSVLVRHRHAGGRTAHVHAGRVAGSGHAVAADVVERTPSSGAALAPVGSADLHAHHVPPAVVAALPALVPPPPTLVGVPLPMVAAPRELSARTGTTRARSPPVAG